MECVYPCCNSDSPKRRRRRWQSATEISDASIGSMKSKRNWSWRLLSLTSVLSSVPLWLLIGGSHVSIGRWNGPRGSSAASLLTCLLMDAGRRNPGRWYSSGLHLQSYWVWVWVYLPPVSLHLYQMIIYGCAAYARSPPQCLYANVWWLSTAISCFQVTLGPHLVQN